MNAPKNAPFRIKNSYHYCITSGASKDRSGNGIHLPYDTKLRSYSFTVGLQSIHTLPFFRIICKVKNVKLKVKNSLGISCLCFAFLEFFSNTF